MSLVSQDPGKRDKRLTLRYSIAERNTIGESVPAWVDAATVWGSALPKGGREFYAAQQKFSEVSVIFRIRHRSDLDSTWRVVLGDDLFEVIHAEEVGRRDYLDVICRALNQSAGSALALLLTGSADAMEFIDTGDGSTPIDLGAAA